VQAETQAKTPYYILTTTAAARDLDTQFSRIPANYANPPTTSGPLTSAAWFKPKKLKCGSSSTQE
jgi:hypothetical protein